MNEKPQEARAGEQGDILEQIITQGLEKMKPVQTKEAVKTPAGETPSASKHEDSVGGAPPAGTKNRRSAVYLYLLVLFGAAFLMLLLAYFIQQRNSESTISGLRDSMNLSREELLDEINGLKAENTALDVKIAQLQRDLTQWQTRYEEKGDELALVWDLYDEIREELYSWQSFWELEQYYQSGDYESCAAVLILQGQSQYTYRAPEGAEERQSEIVRAVIDAGILDEDYEQHPDDYSGLLEAYFSEHLTYGP